MFLGAEHNQSFLPNGCSFHLRIQPKSPVAPRGTQRRGRPIGRPLRWAPRGAEGDFDTYRSLDLIGSTPL